MKVTFYNSLKLKFTLLLFIACLGLTKNSDCIDMLKDYNIQAETSSYILTESFSFMYENISLKNLKNMIDSLVSNHHQEKNYYVMDLKCLIKVAYKRSFDLLSAEKLQKIKTESSRILQTASLNCSSSSYYSVLFGMFLPTATTGTINSQKCSCALGKINVNTKENSIFCGCDNNQFLKEDGTTCVSLSACWNEGKTVIDNYCVICVSVLLLIKL
jgi:hypothetical protein